MEGIAEQLKIFGLDTRQTEQVVDLAINVVTTAMINSKEELAKRARALRKKKKAEKKAKRKENVDNLYKAAKDLIKYAKVVCHDKKKSLGTLLLHPARAFVENIFSKL